MKPMMPPPGVKGRSPCCWGSLCSIVAWDDVLQTVAKGRLNLAVITHARQQVIHHFHGLIPRLDPTNYTYLS